MEIKVSKFIKKKININKEEYEENYLNIDSAIVFGY